MFIQGDKIFIQSDFLLIKRLFGDQNYDVFILRVAHADHASSSDFLIAVFAQTTCVRHVRQLLGVERQERSRTNNK